MRVIENILSSACSGAWNWSDPIELYNYGKNGYLNVVYNITGDGTVALAYSGSTQKNGIYVRESTSIATGGTSISGVSISSVSGVGGHDFVAFNAGLFPFIKIGAMATHNTTTALALSLVAD